jgi:transcription initiation factor TFIIIB Brf1 subunit/transcription initiation factor TFIIB
MTDLWPTLHKAKEAPIAGIDDEVAFDAVTPSTHCCPTCEDSAAIETVGAEVLCTRCGSIVDVPLEWAAEYRWFSGDVGSGGGPDPSRCGFPVNPLMPESSLGTVILNTNQSSTMRRIKRYHMWNLMPYRERTLWTVFEGLQVRASNSGISNAVLDEAKELYAQLTASAICRGQVQRDAMLAACLWEALKRHDAPRMPKDVAEIFNIPLRLVTRGIKQFQHLLAIRTTGGQTDTYAAPQTKSTSEEKIEETPAVIAARAFQRRAVWQKSAQRTTTYEDFIGPFLTNLSMQHAGGLDALVRHVCARTEELNIVPENTPPSLAASVIAFCCNEAAIRVDLAEIARVCGISAVTIQKCLKRLAPWKTQLLAEN